MDFDEFFTRAYPRTVASLVRVLGDRGDAEDVAQEAFHRAVRCWGRIRGYEDPEAWVRRVAVNLALSELRRTRRRAGILRRHLGWRTAAETGVPEVALDLHRALRMLPRQYRVVLTLRYLHDLPLERVATELGLPLETIRSQLRRARQQLQPLVLDRPVLTLQHHDEPGRVNVMRVSRPR